MDFPQNMSMEEAFALAEAEAKLNAALQESKERFDKAAMPDRLNEDWRFGRPHVYAKEWAARFKDGENCFEHVGFDNSGEHIDRLSADDEDLRQTEMLMPTIGSDALLSLHLKRFGDGHVLYIEEDTKEPICLGYGTRWAASPSTFIMVAPGVKAEVAITYACLEIGYIFATCNIQVAEGAELKVRVNAWGDGADGRCMLITNIQNMGGKVAHLTSYQGLRWVREETVAETYTCTTLEIPKDGMPVKITTAKERKNSFLDTKLSVFFSRSLQKTTCRAIIAIYKMSLRRIHSIMLPPKPPSC